MSQERWRTRWGGIEVSIRPVLPGVYRRREGGFVVRGSAKHPNTGRLTEVFRVLRDETDPRSAFAWLTKERERVRAGRKREEPTFPRFRDFAALLMGSKIRSGDLGSAATRELWEDVLEDHLLAAPFANFLVDQIRTRDLLAWKDSIEIGKGAGRVSPHTGNVWIRILKVIVNAYVTKFELERNPALALTPFDTSKWRGRLTREQPNALTADELPMFLALMRRLHPQFFALTALGFALGARPSSLRPLRRSGPERDYNPETGELLLRRSHTRGRSVMPVTKNGQDVSIILPPDLREILRWHVEVHLVEDDPDDRKPRVTRERMAKSELLFPAGRTGSFLSTTALWKPFASVSAAMKAATKGVFTKVITPKAMRRTNKDLMRAAGVRDIVAMAVSNHLDEGMHVRYSTVSGAEMTQAVAKVIDLATFRKAHEAPDALLKGVAVPHDRPHE